VKFTVVQSQSGWETGASINRAIFIQSSLPFPRMKLEAEAEISFGSSFREGGTQCAKAM
jgi:hypothetical protein